MTLVKFAAFIPASLLTVAAIAAGSWQIGMLGEKTGWRGTVALLISALTVLSLIIIALSATVYRFSKQDATLKD